MSKLVPIQGVGLENITPFTHETFERRAFLWTFFCPSSLSESHRVRRMWRTDPKEAVIVVHTSAIFRSAAVDLIKGDFELCGFIHQSRLFRYKITLIDLSKVIRTLNSHFSFHFSATLRLT